MTKIASLALAMTLFAVLTAGAAFAYENITPADAYTLATSHPTTYLLDVRTPAEWKWVGHPGPNKLGQGAALQGKVVNIAYEIEKGGALVLNPSFLSDVNEIFGGNPDSVLIVFCRSGNRSGAAAILLEGAGYRVINMPAGFQGGTDAYGYRTVSGWAKDGLPYTYSGAGYAD